MKKIRALAILNLLFLLLHIISSYGSQLGWYGGKTVGDVSDQYNSLFTPAGSTFAIWGLIYTALLATTIRMIIYAFRFPLEQESNQEVKRIGPWFMINNLLAAAWVYTWISGQITNATVLIFGQLLTLIIIHLRLGIHARFRSLGSKIFTQSSFSIYFGWINVATIANVAIYFVARNWDGAGVDFTADTWAKLMIIAAGFITLLVVFIRRNVLFGLVLVWALWGIIRKRPEEIYADLREVAWVTMVAVAITCGIQLIANMLWRRKNNGRIVS